MTFNKILRWIAVTAIYATLIIPFIVTDSLIFPFITGKNFFFRIVVEIGFAAWLLLALRDVAVRPRMSVLLGAFTIFLAVIGVADIFGDNPWISFWSNFDRMDGYITTLHLFLYFLMAGSLLSEKLWMRFLECSVAGSALMSISGIFQFMKIVGPGVRLSTTFGNASYLAIYLVFNIFFAILLFVRDRIVWKRILLGFAMVLNAFGLYYTATRGAILGIAGGLLLSVVLIDLLDKKKTWKKKPSVYALIAVVVIAAVFITRKDSAFIKNSPVLSRFANISWAESDERQLLWPISLRGIADRPVLGWGQEGFNSVFGAHFSLRLTSAWFDRAHNIILDWLVTGGILGLMAYLSLFAASLWLLWKNARDLSLAEKALYSGLMFAYFFHNLFTFDNIVSYITFATLLAFIQFKSTEYVSPSDLDVKKDTGRDTVVIGTAILMALMLSLYSFNWSCIETARLLEHAAKARAAGNLSQVLSDFEQALSHNHAMGRYEVIKPLLSAVAQMSASGVQLDTSQTFYEISKKAIETCTARNPGNLRNNALAADFYQAYGDKVMEEKYLLKIAEILTNVHVLQSQQGTKVE
ncbi:MAG: O-antigen ligase family protein [Deltaproteobacteria bacterium]|nr:O-antigen ligase family protein [Deltaproteobacteria bacterium]